MTTKSIVPVSTPIIAPVVAPVDPVQSMSKSNVLTDSSSSQTPVKAVSKVAEFMAKNKKPPAPPASSDLVQLSTAAESIPIAPIPENRSTDSIKIFPEKATITKKTASTSTPTQTKPALETTVNSIKTASTSTSNQTKPAPETTSISVKTASTSTPSQTKPAPNLVVAMSKTSSSATKLTKSNVVIARTTTTTTTTTITTTSRPVSPVTREIDSQSPIKTECEDINSSQTKVSDKTNNSPPRTFKITQSATSWIRSPAKDRTKETGSPDRQPPIFLMSKEESPRPPVDSRDSAEPSYDLYETPSPRRHSYTPGHSPESARAARNRAMREEESINAGSDDVRALWRSRDLKASAPAPIGSAGGLGDSSRPASSRVMVTVSMKNYMGSLLSPSRPSSMRHSLTRNALSSVALSSVAPAPASTVSSK